MTKVLFATPPTSMKERYGDMAEAGSSLPSLGILFLAAITRHKGHPTTLIDASALNLNCEQLLNRVEAERPDVLGLSATTFSITQAATFASMIKERVPGIRVFIGGPHVSAAPLETMERFKDFDVAVIGEGEETILELLQAVNAGASFQGIPGIVLRCGEEIVSTSRRPFLHDLDQLPYPAWDLLEGFPERYPPAPFKVRNLPAASLVTSRGCPNHCIFCDRSVFGASCHAFSAEYVVGMIRHLVERYGIREFSFEDDTFITFKKRLVAICQGIINLGVKISWTCLGRVNSVDEETLALMKRAGCWQISFGIESGNQHILTTIHKQATLEQIRKAIALCSKTGMLSKGFFIVGHPGETKETLDQTIKFALELPLDDISVTMLTPFPGTEIFKRADEFGVYEGDWGQMNLLNALFVPYGLTRENLEQTQRELHRRFYLRPRIILGYLRRMLLNPSMTKGMLLGARAFFRSIRNPQ
ncbi:B12-binding domain-containing radical SAM protein [Pelotalea chapellei]|uniref:Cobalamin-dependent protein n=1 Tax=Pelotalea chapellei TaxID=44671 RepID=A0ABS5UA73_9BACT|nr:radical SAM protein [Pelotalea chapellei]MBT1072567.1 cobalamin-dependent protein [Pelotalea chapellei]